MDFTYLVEEGPYKGAERDLSESQRAYLAGFDAAIGDLKGYGADASGELGVDAPETGSASLDAILAEHAASVVDGAAAWLESSRAELLVTMADEATGEPDPSGGRMRELEESLAAAQAEIKRLEDLLGWGAGGDGARS